MDERLFPAVLLALGVLSAAGPTPALAAEQPFIGSAAPPFELPTLEGGSVALADLEGRIVVLHFGAGW